MCYPIWIEKIARQQEAAAVVLSSCRWRSDDAATYCNGTGFHAGLYRCSSYRHGKSIVVFVTHSATGVAIIATANTKADRVMHVQQVTIVVI